MKIALITDTHDNTPAIAWIIQYLNEHSITIALHAGDLINPGVVLRFNKHFKGHFHFIFGNNDGERAGLCIVLQDLRMSPVMAIHCVWS